MTHEQRIAIWKAGLEYCDESVARATATLLGKTMEERAEISYRMNAAREKFAELVLGPSRIEYDVKVEAVEVGSEKP